MSTDTVVFLGPTLSKAEASKCLDAIYRPPAEQGDLVRAVLAVQPRTIILIDGAFGRAPAVRHKEILWAMYRGVQVYGAASMGAIRAAELHPYGMHGSGFVYRWYRSTILADDDEVAVSMSPSELGAQGLSEALINIRLTFRRAERLGLIPGSVRLALEEIARATHFVDRTYDNVFARGRSSLAYRHRVLIDRLEEWVEHHRIDQKREDALALLGTVAAKERTPRQDPKRWPDPFRMTEAWAVDLDVAGLYSGDLLSSLENVPRR